MGFRAKRQTPLLMTWANIEAKLDSFYQGLVWDGFERVSGLPGWLG